MLSILPGALPAIPGVGCTLFCTSLSSLKFGRRLRAACRCTSVAMPTSARSLASVLPCRAAAYHCNAAHTSKPPQTKMQQPVRGPHAQPSRQSECYLSKTLDLTHALILNICTGPWESATRDLETEGVDLDTDAVGNETTSLERAFKLVDALDNMDQRTDVLNWLGPQVRACMGGHACARVCACSRASVPVVLAHLPGTVRPCTAGPALVVSQRPPHSCIASCSPGLSLLDHTHTHTRPRGRMARSSHATHQASRTAVLLTRSFP